MRIRDIGIDPEGFLILGGGFRILALIRKNISKVIMCLRVIRIDPEGFIEMTNSFIVTCLGSKKQTQGW